MNRWSLICPDCGGPVQQGRWELVRHLELGTGKVLGFSARWVPSPDLQCPTPEHGVFK